MEGIYFLYNTINIENRCCFPIWHCGTDTKDPVKFLEKQISTIKEMLTSESSAEYMINIIGGCSDRATG